MKDKTQWIVKIKSLTDFEKVDRIAKLLTDRATGVNASNDEYEALRHDLLHNSTAANCLPDWLKDHRNLTSFWSSVIPWK